MRTTINTFMKAMLMATILIGFTACEIEVGTFVDTDRNSDAYAQRSYILCSRTWVDYYYDADGYSCKQELVYFLDRTGRDLIRTQYPNGQYHIEEYHFNWNWENFDQTAIRMVYGPGDVSYLEGIHLGTNFLSGYLDGWDNYVEFEARY